jgi:hypothetical protein
VSKQLSKGVSANANYTWSHCVGDLTVGNSTGGAGAGLVNPNSRRYDRGNCQSSQIGGVFSSDRREIFKSTVVYETPKLSNRVENMFLSGWRVSGIYRAQSAPWLTVTTATDVALSGAGTQRPVQILANPPVRESGTQLRAQPAASANPAPGTLSATGRDNIPGPAFFDIDAAVGRLFLVTERQNVEFRAEAFNISNSYRSGVPSPSLAAGGFGYDVRRGEFRQGHQCPRSANPATGAEVYVLG